MSVREWSENGTMNTPHSGSHQGHYPFTFGRQTGELPEASRSYEPTRYLEEG